MNTSGQRKWWHAFQIELGLQKRLLFMLGAITGIGILFSAVLFWFFYQNLMDQIVGGDLPFMYSPEQMAAIAEQMPSIRSTLFLWVCILTLLNITLIVLAVILVIHRLSGPIYRIKKTLAEVADGDLTVAVGLRKNDDFKDVANGLDQIIARFQIVVLALQDHVRILEAAEKANDLVAIQNARVGLKDALSYFDTVTVQRSEGDARER